MLAYTHKPIHFSVVLLLPDMVLINEIWFRFLFFSLLKLFDWFIFRVFCLEWKLFFGAFFRFASNFFYKSKDFCFIDMFIAVWFCWLLNWLFWVLCFRFSDLEIKFFVFFCFDVLEFWFSWNFLLEILSFFFKLEILIYLG